VGGRQFCAGRDDNFAGEEELHRCVQKQGLGFGGVGLGGQPFVEGDGEGEEFFFPVEGVDHLDVDFGVPQGGLLEGFDVVEEVSGEGAVGVDDGALEAEVVVVVGDLLVDGSVVDGNGDDGQLLRLRAADGEQAAVELFEVGGGDAVVVGGDELHAGVVEREGGVAVVGDDDADGDHGVGDVGEAEELAVPLVVAGVDGDGDVFAGVAVVGRVLGGGSGGRGFSVRCVGGGERCEGERGGHCGGGDGALRDRREAFGQGEDGGVAIRIHAGLIIIHDMTMVNLPAVARGWTDAWAEVWAEVL
jgi:hypothetical protein